MDAKNRRPLNKARPLLKSEQMRTCSIEIKKQSTTSAGRERHAEDAGGRCDYHAFSTDTTRGLRFRGSSIQGSRDMLTRTETYSTPLEGGQSVVCMTVAIIACTKTLQRGRPHRTIHDKGIASDELRTDEGAVAQRP